MKISDHITYAEAIHSNTAKRKNIDNTPNETQVEAMKLLAEKVFEPLREWVGGPIKVNSFFFASNNSLTKIITINDIRIAPIFPNNEIAVSEATIVLDRISFSPITL